MTIDKIIVGEQVIRMTDSASGHDVDFGRDVRIALADHHRRFDHGRRPVRLQLVVRHGLDPVSAEQLDSQSGRAEVAPEGLGVVDAAVAVVQINVVQTMLGRQQIHHDAHLAVKASGIGYGREYAAICVQPGPGTGENSDGVVDVFEYVAEHDVVERPTGLVILEQATIDADSWMALTERLTEDLGPLDTGEVVEVLDQQRRAEAFRRPELEAGPWPPVAGEYANAVRNGRRVDALAIPAVRGDAGEAFPFRGRVHDGVADRPRAGNLMTNQFFSGCQTSPPVHGTGRGHGADDPGGLD